jgi:TolB-like protein/Flp pilus assembly protein TadD
VTDAPTEREDGGAWAKLRRRKVVQWGLAYAAAAWTLLQVIEYLGETYSWPPAIRQIATPSFALGLVFVLVLAWYHGDRGEQRVSRPELAILATIVALVGGTLWWYVSRIDESAWVADTGVMNTKHALPPDAASIAVLPFVNMSPDKDQEYFADGMSEELLNLLTQLPQLRVIARTSSFSFKGKEVDIATIARTLNVAHVLEGSVRKSGDTVRITVQLIRASDSSHLWSQTYDRKLADVFQVQDDIARAVVSELKIKLLAAPPKARATDPKAYALFLQAREIDRQRTVAAREQSIALYQQALALDPAYTAAWVGLADAYCSPVYPSLQRRDEGIRLAREAIEKALALDPEYAPAHAQLGYIAGLYTGDLAAAARHHEHALALEPANPDILRFASALARRLGRLDKAIAIGEYQIARDPVSAEGHYSLGLAYRYAGRLDEAIAEFRTALRLSPGHRNAHAMIGEVLLQKGDAQGALAEIQQEADAKLRLDGLPLAYHALGRKVESDAALAELIRKYEQTSAYTIATVLAYRGEADRAFEWLDKAVQYDDPNLGSLAVYPLFTNLHSDPRWLPFLRKVGIAPEQLAAIQFDVTLPK